MAAFAEYVCCFALLCFVLFLKQSCLFNATSAGLWLSVSPGLAAILIFTASNVGKVWTFLGERGCVLLFFNEQRVKLIRSDDFDKEKRKILNQVNGGRSRWSDSWHVWILNIKLQKCWSNVPTLSALTCNCHQQKWSSRSCHLAVRCQCPYGVEETPQ